MIPAEVAIDAGSAGNRPGGPLVIGRVFIERAGGDQAVAKCIIFIQPLHVPFGIVAQRGQIALQPGFQCEIPAQSAGRDDAPQKPAAGQFAVDLLGALGEQLALRLPDLQRRRIRQMPEIGEVIINALQLGEQRTHLLRAAWHGAA